MDYQKQARPDAVPLNQAEIDAVIRGWKAQREVGRKPRTKGTTVWYDLGVEIAKEHQMVWQGLWARGYRRETR